MFSFLRPLLPLLLVSALPVRVLAGNVLSSNGFTTCLKHPTVEIERMNAVYNRTSQDLLFDVAGSSTVEQNVTLSIYIYAYGQQVYERDLNPCDDDTYIQQLCPVPAASFAAQGLQQVPDQFASQIPSIVFAIPDLDGAVTMQIVNSVGTEVACIQSDFSNGQTLTVPAISYAAAGIAAAAVGLSMVGAVSVSGLSGLSGVPGAPTTSPSGGDMIGWFQGIAMSGMLSVSYPRVYQSFTTNFAFSSGLIPWSTLQISIDNFRNSTGGNLTNDSYQYLVEQATLVYSGGNTDASTSSMTKRTLHRALRLARDSTASFSVNGTSETIGISGNTTAAANSTLNAANSTTTAKDPHFVQGIEAYVEQLMIPRASVFMTVLLVFAILVGFIIVSILFIKLILELWSMWGTLPKSLESWRKRYWWRLAKTLTNLIMLLYGMWTLYCIYQFTDGDSWAATVLAGVTLGIFTIVLAGFTWKIYSKAHAYRKASGDAHQLFEDKEVWVKYSLFYDNYKRSYWWIFVPAIVYTFAKGFIIAGLNNHGLVQVAGELLVEGVMLCLLLWSRPYQRRSGNVINVSIQVIRVLMTVCVLVFVEELGISQTTKTITGVVLLVVQCIMTAILAILIVVNLFINLCKVNPHRKARKDKEASLTKDLADLPHDSRSSLALDGRDIEKDADMAMYKAPLVGARAASPDDDRDRDLARRSRFSRGSLAHHASSESVSSLASYHDREDRGLLAHGPRHRVYSASPPRSREPRLPDVALIEVDEDDDDDAFHHKPVAPHAM